MTFSLTTVYWIHEKRKFRIKEKISDFFRLTRFITNTRWNSPSQIGTNSNVDFILLNWKIFIFDCANCRIQTNSLPYKFFAALIHFLKLFLLSQTVIAFSTSSTSSPLGVSIFWKFCFIILTWLFEYQEDINKKKTKHWLWILSRVSCSYIYPNSCEFDLRRF